MGEIKRNYYQDYVDGKIEFLDIPVEELNSKILKDAIVKEPNKLIEFLLNMVEQRKMNIELLKYIRMIPDNLVKDEYYERYFELNPVKHYLKLPHSKRTMKMALRLMEINPDNIEILLERHKTKEVCEQAFSHDVRTIMFIPSRYITEEMCEVALKKDASLLGCFPLEFRTEDMYKQYIREMASKVRVSISKAYGREWWSNRADFLGFLKNVPSKYINQETYNEMFKLNPLLLVGFPDEFKTDEMCEKIYQMYGESYEEEIISFMPVNKRWNYYYRDELKGKSLEEIKEFYYNEFKDHPKNKIDFIPLEYRTQKVYDLLFNSGGAFAVDKIPKEFRTQAMWDRVVFNAEDADILKEVPEQFITQEMCDYLYNLYGTRVLYFIPSRYLTKEMYVELLNDDIYNNLKMIEVDKLDEDILSLIVVRLKKIISDGKIVDANIDVIGVIVKIYPYLIRAFDKDNISKIIIQDLYQIIENDGTIESIAKKYDLSVTYINGILDNIKNIDINAYEAIKNVLDMNQNKWFYNMQNDVYNLDIIISLLGDLDTGKLDINQKIKFAYLYLKNINNSLEEIYNFNYNKYTDKDYSLIDSFFRRILKYNYLFGMGKDVITVPESKTIKFNNSWLRNYDRNKFFAIKNGKPTLEPRYGKKGELLTLEIEEKIINELVNNGIPLNDIIVQGAFREYFNKNLEAYIEQFREYDREFMVAKKGRDSR